MEKIIITIVDKQALFRIGVCHALSSQSDFKVLEAAPCDGTLELIQTYSTNVLLLDIDYPSLRGLDLARKMPVYCPATKVVMLTINSDDGQLFEIIKTGAVAYMDKNATSSELLKMVRQVANGEYLINESVLARPKVANRVLRQFQNMQKSSGHLMEEVAAAITPREKQILTYVADGNSNKQIAYILRISEQTAKNHISNILRKLNANDRAHAVVLAIRNGWILAEGAEYPAITANAN